MMRWIRRGAALLCGLSIATLLASRGENLAAGAAALAGLAWGAADRLPGRLFGAANACMLIASTVATALLALRGATVGRAVITVALGLLAWNTGLFVARWPAAPAEAGRRYLAAVAKPLLVGVSLGVSAPAAFGLLSVPAPVATLLMLLACALFIGIVRGAR